MEESTKRVTKEQKLLLLQYMEEHAEFAHDRFVNSTGAKSLSEQWNALAEMLNASGGACKTGENWKRAWVNMRSKAKQKFQDCKNALERSGVNGFQKNKLTELDERVVAVMSKVAVVGEQQVGEPLRMSQLVPEIVLLPDDEDNPQPSVRDEDEQRPCTSTKTATKIVTSSRKRKHDAESSFLALEREILAEKRRKNDIAEEQVRVLQQIKDHLAEICRNMPQYF